MGKNLKFSKFRVGGSRSQGPQKDLRFWARKVAGNGMGGQGETRKIERAKKGGIEKIYMNL